MEEEFRALLTGSAAVTALVPASRISFGAHPQGAGWPGIVLQTVSAFKEAHMQGPDGLLRGRVQVDCYALTYAEAKRVARAVIETLHARAIGGFRPILWVAARDSREGGTNEADRPFRSSLDFTIAWRETNG